jgi:predicted DsbA family dithiol-disulfide isomerase
MEAVVQILEADDLAPVMYIPSEMRHGRIEVSIRPLEKTSEKEKQTANINAEIMQKFLKAAELGEAKEHLRKKMNEGAQFDFDALKLISGNMTEADWQNLYFLQKQAWPNAAAKKIVH